MARSGVLAAAGRFGRHALHYNAGNSGKRSTMIKVNGTVVFEGGITGSGDIRPADATVLQLADGDAVTLAVYVDGGSVSVESWAASDVHLALARF